MSPIVISVFFTDSRESTALVDSVCTPPFHVHVFGCDVCLLKYDGVYII